MSNGIYLLLGSNLGSKSNHLQIAKDWLAETVGAILKQSSIYETESWGVADEPSYLNQVIEIDTALAPQQLLTAILAIEERMGRVREKRWHSRTIDIDILFYNDQIIDSDRLQIPHPRIHERNFTLIPLAEITPAFIHPTLHKSIAELLTASQDSLKVIRLE